MADFTKGPWRPMHDLPLTNPQRGELLRLERYKTNKTLPRNIVNDLINKGYWPEELRLEGRQFLEGKEKLRTVRSDLRRWSDPLNRSPGHALREFEREKRYRLEEEKRLLDRAKHRKRAEALQGLDEEGLWNKKFVGEIKSTVNLVESMGLDYLKREIARANMESVPRALKKEGWTVRHTSSGRDKRRSSRYLVSPDRKFEVRLSDHYLPATSERDYMREQTGGPRWDEDIVISGTESPRSIIDEIKDLYENEVIIAGDKVKEVGTVSPSVETATGQSNLPALTGPPERKTKKDRPLSGKGQMFRGLGSLMRGRIFPLIQAAQAGWDALTPEQKEMVEEQLRRPTHELFGMEKPGLEYFKDLLGFGDLPGIGHNSGIISLPEGDDLTKSRMYSAPPGSKPEYLGAGVDRSEYTHLRYKPKKLPEKTQKALDALRDNRNGIKDRVVSMVRRGQQLGGDSWYNTEELRDWFITELGPERGHDEWREFMGLMGAASTGNKVPSNIAIASMYRNFGPQAAKKLARSHLEEEGDIPRGYGHKQQKNHALNVLSYYEGTWTPDPEDPKIPKSEGSWAQNPKPKGFTSSLLGGKTNIAADLHFTRIMGMASKDPRYLDNNAGISDTLAQQLKEKYGRKITTRFLKKNKDKKWVLKARDSVIKGPANLEEFMGEAQVWQGSPDKVEYAAFEQFTNELAGELGMTGPQLQANLWMGAADVTGVDPTSQGTFMELLRKRAEVIGKKTDTPTVEVLRNFIRNRGKFSDGGLVTFGKGDLMYRDNPGGEM